MQFIKEEENRRIEYKASSIRNIKNTGKARAKYGQPNDFQINHLQSRDENNHSSLQLDGCIQLNKMLVTLEKAG